MTTNEVPGGDAPGTAQSDASPSLVSAPLNRVHRLASGERLIGPALGIAALIVFFLFLSAGNYISTILEDVVIYAIAAMGLDFLGYGGLISLGQAGFLGVGAYGVAIAEAHGFTAWEGVGLSIGVVLALAVVSGVMAVRVSGITFVIITLALGQIFWGLTYQWTSLTSGDNGIPLTTVPYLGPFNLSTSNTFDIATFVVFLIVLWLLLLMVRSPFGLSLRGLKSNERRLRALGYRTGVQRYVAYIVSSLIAGIAGILFVFNNHLITPSALTFSQDGFLVLMVIVGGLASIWGPCIGAIVIVLFQQEVSIYVSRWETLMGVVFIAAVIFTPDGVAGILRKIQLGINRAVSRRWRRHGEGGAPVTGSVAEGTAVVPSTAAGAPRGEAP